MAKQSNPTASSVLDALNSEEEISSEDNESEYDNTSDCEVTEERTDQEIEQGGTDSEQGPSSSPSIPSLLSVLRAPRLSDLTRKRKTQTNPGKPRKKTRPTSSAASEPKGVKPQDRLKKFPKEQLSVSAGKLFCKACREELSLKSSSLSNHLKSQKIKMARDDYKRKRLASEILQNNWQFTMKKIVQWEKLLQKAHKFFV